MLCKYEALLDRYGVGYGGDIKQHVNPARLARFFADGAYQRLRFDNEQRFDLAGFRGRLTSSSYCPAAEHPNFQPMMAGLADLYDRYQKGGEVALRYDTLAFLGVPG